MHLKSIAFSVNMRIYVYVTQRAYSDISNINFLAIITERARAFISKCMSLYFVSTYK